MAREFANQFGKLPRPLAANPRQPGGRPLHGFKRIPDALAKRFAADDALLDDIRKRLGHLERSAGIVPPGKPEART